MTVIKRLIKRKVLLLGMLALMFSASAQNKSYISNHKLLAAVLSERYGIPASVILSIAAIESSGGVGPAAKVLNNHFGMEGRNHVVTPNGKKSRYKQYNNVIESYIDFCNVIVARDTLKRPRPGRTRYIVYFVLTISNSAQHA
jgi:Bax protein